MVNKERKEAHRGGLATLLLLALTALLLLTLATLLLLLALLPLVLVLLKARGWDYCRDRGVWELTAKYSGLAMITG